MCLLAFAWQCDAGRPLVVAANRDEFFDRPAAPAHWWEDAPAVLAGRDLAAGGTWMGVTRTGRFAALTNYRAPDEKNPAAPSRGALVADFLRSDEAPQAWLARHVASGAAWNGFNLLVGSHVGAARGELWIWSNRDGAPRRLEPGIYGLSNGLLDTPWPKLTALKATLRSTLDSDLARLPEPGALQEHLLAALRDPTEAPDELLPSTGVPLDWERHLSAAFIRLSAHSLRGVSYGTRASTVLTVSAPQGAEAAEVCLIERSFDAEARHDDVTFAFALN